jgi:hypothetical protein|tara:strand:- start:157 stop:357 length:201 start_codon:yes stop_codon:yes gene_type:complete
MDLKKVLEVSNEPSVKSNKDLEEGLKYLNEEFEKTKFSIVELTKHMDKIEKLYNNINDEIGNRLTK